MKNLTRSEFLGMGAGLAAGAALTSCSPPGTTSNASVDPDLILLNGVVYTMDSGQPSAEAFAVKNGRLVAVGSNDNIRNLAHANCEVIDAEGMTVTPGFIDAHSHPSAYGVAELVHVDVNLPSIEEIKKVLRKRAAKTPPGQWVIGFKYDDTKLKEGRAINRLDLDEAVPDHPVVVGHRGGHTSVYNSKAFELAGVTALTTNPEGGKFYVEDGQLTGLAAETADEQMRELVPSGSNREQRSQGVGLISQMMTAAGLTSVTDANVGLEAMQSYQDAYHSSEMRFRVYMMISGASKVYEGLRSAGIYTGFGDEHLRIGGVKFFVDGSASERTMRMSTPFVGRPDDYGILVMQQKDLHEVVEEAHRNKFQIGIHANGDVAIDMVLQAYERVQEKWPLQDFRHRIEHCSLINPELLKRIKATGAIPTPFYTYVHYHGNKWVHYGEEKMCWMFAHGSFLEYGIPVASASDYIPGPFEPLMAIQSMVTRKDYKGRIWGPNQRISVDQALEVCTVNAARASFEEKIKGSISSGKLADFVILAEDPHTVEPDRIKGRSAEKQFTQNNPSEIKKRKNI
jgi:predicted amidohydrolase YtcJ